MTTQAYLVSLRFTVLHRCCVFLQTEGKTLHLQKDYDSLYCDTLFVAVVWNPIRSISKVRLYRKIKQGKGIEGGGALILNRVAVKGLFEKMSFEQT